MSHVNVGVYTDSAKKLTDIGAGVDKATSTLMKALADTGRMSGSSESSTKWATAYDKRAGDAIDVAHKLSQLLPYYGSLIALAGYNHAYADWKANVDPNKGAPPDKPAEVAHPVDLCWVHPPSAGGPGNGLVSVAELLDKIHIHIPDGNTDKLGMATSAWKAFNQDDAIAKADVDIDAIRKAMSAQDSPEIANITEQLTTLYDIARHLWGTSNQLIDDTIKLKKALDDLRDRINDILKALDLALAGGLILSIAADFFSAGAAASLTPGEIAAADAAVEIAADNTVKAVSEAAIEGAGGILESAAVEENTLAEAGGELDELASLTAEDVGDVAEEEAATEATPQAATKLQSSLEYGRTQQSMDHVFVPKHKLDALVASCGDEQSAMDAIVNSVQDAPNGIYGKANPLVRTINGQTVTIRGAMIDGVFKISTAFVP